MARRRQAVTHQACGVGCSVSLQTVSRVINDEPNVRPAMRARVQDSIDRLGYVPSIAAQRMSGSRSYLILALNDRERTIAEWQSREGSDWVDQMLLGGMLTCAKYGYRLMVELVDTHADHVERELAAAFAALQAGRRSADAAPFGKSSHHRLSGPAGYPLSPASDRAMEAPAFPSPWMMKAPPGAPHNC